MKVYFIRHGESVLTDKRYQPPETPLSDLGTKQATAIAQRLTCFPIDLILTSSYTRALQTAQVIEKANSIPLLQSDLLTERKMPTLFLGKSIDDPAIIPIHQTIRKHFYDPQWHYAEEENFSDLLSRVKISLDFIHSQQKENIIIVTHGYFLSILIFYVLFGDQVNPELFTSFRDHAICSNAGLTLCKYEDKKWKLLSWNDCAHLSDIISS